MLRNRWNVYIRVGFRVEARTGRNGDQSVTGVVRRVDTRSTFARAYGPQVEISVPHYRLLGPGFPAIVEGYTLQTICADGITRASGVATLAETWGTVLRIFDNGGRSFDRFTILPPRWAGDEWRENAPGHYWAWSAIGASAQPFHPQGFGQHCAASPGPHLGRRIGWNELPDDVQRFARESFPEFAPKG